MALIKCSECGKEVSKMAQICPNCGKAFPGRTKTEWTILYISIIFLCLAIFIPMFISMFS